MTTPMKKALFLLQIAANSMHDVNRLFFNHANSYGETDGQDIRPLLGVVDAMSRIDCASTLVIDFDRHELIYKSDTLIFLDESSIRDIQRDCSNPYWSLVTEETLEKLLLIRNRYLLPGQELSEEDYAHHVNIIDFPILIRGHELFVTQKFTPLIMRNDGITKVGLFTFRHSTKTSMESAIIAPSGKRFRFDFNEGRYTGFDLATTLTLTEKTILHRVKMGMSNEEIAKSLYITVNTVKTHRNKIFKKLHVDSMSEAMSVVGNYNLLF